MAFDGITVAALTKELKETICDGRIAKIAQPESDELLLTIKTKEGQRRLSISASASLPLIYLTNDNKPSPMTAPNFCMLLRKHIGNGRIVDVSQPGLERIIQLRIEHLDELGDLRQKRWLLRSWGNTATSSSATKRTRSRQYQARAGSDELRAGGSAGKALLHPGYDGKAGSSYCCR